MVNVKKQQGFNGFLSKRKQIFIDFYKDIRQSKTSYLFLLPFTAVFFAFTILPVIISIFFSFTSYNILEPAKFVSWDNYIRLFFNDDVFITALKNTIIFAVVTGPIGYFLSLMVAWLICEQPPKLRAFLTLVFYAPTISGQAYVIFKIMFSNDAYGYVNGFLMKFGPLTEMYEPIKWLENEKYVLTVIIIAALWMSMGAGFLSLVAGFQQVDPALFEAGYIDGIGNRWQELWFVTLPSMKPQLLFSAVMSITASFAAADLMNALAGFPSVGYAAHTIVTHLMDYGSIRYELGYASAIATVLFIIMVGLNKLVQKLLGKIGQ